MNELEKRYRKLRIIAIAVIVLCVAGLSYSVFAQAPKASAPAPPKVVDLLPADATAIPPLLAKAKGIEDQIVALQIQLRGPDKQSGVLGDLQKAEQAALVNLKLNMAYFKISADGKHAEPRQPIPGISQPGR